MPLTSFCALWLYKPMMIMEGDVDPSSNAWTIESLQLALEWDSRWCWDCMLRLFCSLLYHDLLAQRSGHWRWLKILTDNRPWFIWSVKTIVNSFQKTGFLNFSNWLLSNLTIGQNRRCEYNVRLSFKPGFLSYQLWTMSKSFTVLSSEGLAWRRHLS